VAYGGMAGGTLKLGGGQMVGPAVFWAGFDTLQGFGVIANALVVDSSFDRIAVSGGSLTLGSLNHTQGFNHRGLIEVEAGRTLALHSAGVAPIGSQTLLGEGATLLSVNGVVMGAGERLEAGGNARVVGDFRNNGSVVGPAGDGQLLTFNDDVSGAGTFAGKVRFNQLYSPGNSTAAVSLERLQLADSATLLLELQGDAAGAGFDQVRVSGDALLDGDLLLQFGTGFTPQAGQHFELISWQQHSGQFDDVGISGLGSGLRAELSYGAGGLSLTVSAVPEPESWALLLAGGAWIAALARRRRAGR